MVNSGRVCGTYYHFIVARVCYDLRLESVSGSYDDIRGDQLQTILFSCATARMEGV